MKWARPEHCLMCDALLPPLSWEDYADNFRLSELGGLMRKLSVALDQAGPGAQVVAFYYCECGWSGPLVWMPDAA